MAIVDRPVRLVEEARSVQQVAQLGTRETVFAPVDLGRAAGPGFPFEDGPAAFGKFPIEPAVVGDDDDCFLDEGIHGRFVDSMSPPAIAALITL